MYNAIDETDPGYGGQAPGELTPPPNAMEGWTAPAGAIQVTNANGQSIVGGDFVASAGGWTYKGAKGTVTTAPDGSTWFVPSPAVTPPPTGGGGTPGPTAPPDLTKGLLAPYTKTFQAPPTLNLGGLPGIEYIPPAPSFRAPAYTPPPAFSYQDFRAPTLADALNDPGYQFRTQQGEDALQRWAAAKGTLNDSQTAKALINYGQNAATQGYRDVWDRRANEYSMNRANAVDAYNRNYQTQYADPYQIAFQGAGAEFAPTFSGWQTNAQAGQRQNEVNTQQAWDLLNWDYKKWLDQRDSTYNKLFQYAMA